MDRLLHEQDHTGIPSIPAIPANGRQGGPRGGPERLLRQVEGVHEGDEQRWAFLSRQRAYLGGLRRRPMDGNVILLVAFMQVTDLVQMRLWVFDHYKEGLGLPEGGKGDSENSEWADRLRTYLKALEERPSIKNTLSDQEHYLPIYQRYADNKAQSELAKAIRKGRGVP